MLTRTEYCFLLYCCHADLQLSSEKSVTAQLQAENAAGRAELEKVRGELAGAKEQLQGAQAAQVRAVCTWTMGLGMLIVHFLPAVYSGKQVSMGYGPWKIYSQR